MSVFVTTTLSMFGIALGVAALIIVLSVMNGFQTANPGVTIDYQANGSGAGIKDFINKQTAFAGSDSALKDQAAFFYVPGDVKGKPLPLDRHVRLGGMVETGSIQRQADGVRHALAQRARGGLDAGGDAHLGVARRLAVQLAEVAQLAHRQVVAREVQQRVDQHRAVTGRQHEAVPVGPVRPAGVELEELANGTARNHD